MAAIDLSKNEFQHPHPPALSATGLPDEDGLKRYPRLDLLRDRLAALHEVAGDGVFLQPGGATALMQIFLAHSWSCGGTGTVLLPALTWQYYEEVAARIGSTVHPLPMVRSAGRYDFDIAAAGHLLKRHPNALTVLTLPNNPSGSNLSAAELREICAAAGPAGIILIDQVYHGFGPASFTPAELLAAVPNAIVLRTFSKLYGLAGVRIAYLLAGAEARRRLRLVQPYLGTSAVAERIALFCLDNQDYYDRIAAEVVAERDRLAEFLNGLGCCECFRSDANFLLLHMPRLASDYVAFLGRHNIAVRLYDSGTLTDHVRITIGTPAQMEMLRQLTRQFAAAAAGTAHRLHAV